MLVASSTSQRLKPDKKDGPEVAFDELFEARSWLKAVLLYAAECLSSFSKEISNDCCVSPSWLRLCSSTLVVNEGLADDIKAGCILSMFLNLRDILTLDFSTCWIKPERSLVVVWADSNEVLQQEGPSQCIIDVSIIRASTCSPHQNI